MSASTRTKPERTHLDWDNLPEWMRGHTRSPHAPKPPDGVSDPPAPPSLRERPFDDDGSGHHDAPFWRKPGFVEGAALGAGGVLVCAMIVFALIA